MDDIPYFKADVSILRGFAMKESLTSVVFEVTERNIQLGVRQDCCFCAVALAVKKELIDSIQVFSMKNVLILQNRFNHEFIHSVVWPVKVASFIEDIDANKPVKPFKFNMKIPKELLFKKAKQ